MKKHVNVLIGIISGFLSGIAGGFGAVVSIIGIKKYYLLSQKKAQAISMAYLWLVSLVAVVMSNKEMQINMHELILLVLGGSVGTLIGSKLLSKFKNKTIEIIFGIILIVSGTMVIMR